MSPFICAIDLLFCTDINDKDRHENNKTPKLSHRLFEKWDTYRLDVILFCFSELTFRIVTVNWADKFRTTLCYPPPEDALMTLIQKLFHSAYGWFEQKTFFSIESVAHVNLAMSPALDCVITQ